MPSTFHPHSIHRNAAEFVARRGSDAEAARKTPNVSPINEPIDIKFVGPEFLWSIAFIMTEKKLKFSYWINGTEIAGYIAKLLAFPFSLQKVGWDLRSLCWPMDLWTVGCFKINWYIHFVDIRMCKKGIREHQKAWAQQNVRVIQSGQREQRSKQCMQMSKHWANDSVPYSWSSYHFYSNREGWTR